MNIRYRSGFINITAPPNANGHYSPCGRTGVGVAEIISKTEEIILDNQVYAVQGMEVIGESEHTQMFILELEDGAQINFGGGSTDTTSYDDYLENTKGDLLQILGTYKPGPQ